MVAIGNNSLITNFKRVERLVEQVNNGPVHPNTLNMRDLAFIIDSKMTPPYGQKVGRFNAILSIPCCNIGAARNMPQTLGEVSELCAQAAECAGKTIKEAVQKASNLRR